MEWPRCLLKKYPLLTKNTLWKDFLCSCWTGAFNGNNCYANESLWTLESHHPYNVEMLEVRGTTSSQYNDNNHHKGYNFSLKPSLNNKHKNNNTKLKKPSPCTLASEALDLIFDETTLSIATSLCASVDSPNWFVCSEDDVADITTGLLTVPSCDTGSTILSSTEGCGHKAKKQRIINYLQMYEMRWRQILI